jgi:plasmid stabilization system protein ParE
MFTIIWKPSSEISFSEEVYFIFNKWNQKELDNFAFLVDENLDRLSKNPTLGIFNSKENCYSFVISKQTTLYYHIIEEQNQIDLLYFWNNSKNPNDLAKLL